MLRGRAGQLRSYPESPVYKKNQPLGRLFFPRLYPPSPWFRAMRRTPEPTSSSAVSDTPSTSPEEAGGSLNRLGSA